MRTIAALLCVPLLSAPAQSTTLREKCIEARAIVYRAQTIGELYELATVASGTAASIAEALGIAHENPALQRHDESFFEFAKRLLAESLDDECGGDM